jgi:NADH:ubiquinone reductase (H+-translocating)
VLVEGESRVLPTYPPALSEAAARRLTRLGIELRLGQRVTGLDEGGVTMGSERLPARSIVWAAGVAASPLARSLDVPLDRAGRVIVRPDLTIPGHDEVFVVGDLAAIRQSDGAPDGQPELVPGVSPAAMQEGRHAARSIRRSMAGQPREPFRYFDKGSFAVIGRGAAVGNLLNRVPLKGLVAWLGWLFIHLYFLIGFRNRLLVLIDWAYSYLFFRRGARLITGNDRLEGLLASPDAAASPVPSPAPRPAAAVGAGPAPPAT